MIRIALTIATVLIAATLTASASAATMTPEQQLRVENRRLSAQLAASKRVAAARAIRITRLVAARDRAIADRNRVIIARDAALAAIASTLTTQIETMTRTARFDLAVTIASSLVDEQDCIDGVEFSPSTSTSSNGFASATIMRWGC